MSDRLLVDPLCRTITFHDHTWFDHILSVHPELTAHRDLAEAAIEVPSTIRISRRDSDARLYYGLGPRPQVMIVVVVDVLAGLVKTAHLAKRISGGPEEWSSPTP